MSIDFNKRFEGTVKFYAQDKAYGFIYVYNLGEGEENKSLFFHKTHLKGLLPPQEGDKVNFFVKEGDRGLYCDDIKMGGLDGENE